MWWEKKQPPAPPRVRTPWPASPSPKIADLGEPMTDTIRRETVAGPNQQNETFLGRSMVFHGELSGGEDLLIEGQVDGALNLQDHCVTVGPNGRVKANINARQVITQGSVTGNISARDKIEIRRTGRVVGDLRAAAVAIEEGAYFKGSIEILREDSQASSRVHSTAETSGSGA